MNKQFNLLAICVFASILQTCVAQEDFQVKALDLHNQYREKHHAPDLELDDELNSLATQCAEYYANQGQIDHTCPYKEDNGENLAGGEGSWDKDEFAEMSTNMWYDEVDSYDYDNPGFSGATGHFTQLVWVNSQKLGFGYAEVNGYTASVGLYSPAGNYPGEFEENVLAP